MKHQQRQLEIMINLDVKGFCRFLKDQGYEQPRNDKVALMAIHKARIKSTAISTKLKEESKKWLIENGCKKIG